MYIELQLFHLPDPHANLTQNVDTEFQLHFGVLVQKDARLLRDLRIMAYFKQCFSSDSNISTIKELAHALASHCPYEVPIASIKIRHLHCEVPSSEIFFSLNATIVGLAVDSEGPENLPSCLGLGQLRKRRRMAPLLSSLSRRSSCPALSKREIPPRKLNAGKRAVAAQTNEILAPKPQLHSLLSARKNFGHPS
ncbi:hypothetical protein JHK86_051901 [Glycine max]|nr:hypothetical protein JHK86_051901 [Glycine max]